MSESDKYLWIFNHFGLENQIEKLKEEFNELNEAIEENNREHIVEETADVQNVLNQFKVVCELVKKIYTITDDELSPVMEFKNDRTLERINSGYYKKESEING